MNKNLLIPLIAIISVLIMFILNYVVPEFPAWISVAAGGITIMFVNLLGKK